jgi:MbtH protein
MWSVVINDEGQYALWRDGSAVPAGWRAVDVHGTKAECLAHVGRVWTDLAPLSVRRDLERRRAREA